eukprot:TRINITY_DN1755_c0_g1_i4.p1 TRINITY_DN1755_c0_g1~~TRINITY_DN1755_c0_g1_i4.p1  ORF type:complete len:184 (-),score=34.02 TRINITY_DN1755_c0_g1_i4:68-619(-)
MHSLRTSTPNRHSGRANSVAAVSVGSASPDLSLGLLLADQELKTDFEHFLQAEFSSENLHFLQAVEAFRSAPSQGAAQKVIALYIIDTAPLQVNISNHAKKRLEDYYATAAGTQEVVFVRPQQQDAPETQALPGENGVGLRDLFDEAEAEISRLIEFDSLRRFTLQFSHASAPTSRTNGESRA